MEYDNRMPGHLKQFSASTLREGVARSVFLNRFAFDPLDDESMLLEKGTLSSRTNQGGATHSVVAAKSGFMSQRP